MQKRFSTEGVESIMKSLGGMQPAAAPDYFYTRLKGRMQREESAEEKPFFLLRPAFISSALVLFLVINVAVLFHLKQDVPQPVSFHHDNRPATIESFAAAYNMGTQSVYE